MQLSSVFVGLVISLTVTVYAAPVGEYYTIEADSEKRDVEVAHPNVAYQFAEERAEHNRVAHYVSEKRAPEQHPGGYSYLVSEPEKRDFEAIHDGGGYDIADKRAPANV
ncbi:hypothetical protein FIBSPDRAFT_867781 [Athelia psychrophila]|uniref:Uncharacterized protein n=1 Tax=Athelia psychrophila TaxID=1759441 RepID=A0A166DQ98_9AGAM|nr:hypothetical protein FIBSPDRAFT_867781 [Fibularhizoctonia sp. CBS 109695]